jgi:AraC family transcriptional regulator
MGLAVKFFVIPFFLVAATLGIYLFFYLGAFREVQVQLTESGPYTLIYKDHIGAYHKINAVISEVEKWLQDQGQKCDPSFGEYLDNPKITEEARLRSHGGCVVQKIPRGLPAGFQAREVSRRQFVMATFTGSPAIGPMRVYPKIEKLVLERNLRVDGPMLELYHIVEDQGMETRYLQPVRF